MATLTSIDKILASFLTQKICEIFYFFNLSSFRFRVCNFHFVTNLSIIMMGFIFSLGIIFTRQLYYHIISEELGRVEQFMHLIEGILSSKMKMVG